jgi:uncharacterized protein (DUF58 family)
MPAALIQALDLRIAKRAGGQLPGEHRAPGVGVGSELAQLRPYQPGDDVRQLDPAASARTTIPHVRVHVPERILTTWLVLDVSPSMAFGTAERLKSDVAEGVVQAMGRLAIRRGGKVALLTCGSPLPRLAPPRGGRRALAGLDHVLAQGVAGDGHADRGGLAAALTRLGRLARHAGLVAIVSDFRDQDEWRGPLRLLTARHSVVAIEVTDPREGDLPALGHLSLVDPETGQLVEVDTSRAALRERFAAAEAARRADLADELRRARVHHIRVSTSGSWLRDLGRALK